MSTTKHAPRSLYVELHDELARGQRPRLRRTAITIVSGIAAGVAYYNAQPVYGMMAALFAAGISAISFFVVGLLAVLSHDNLERKDHEEARVQRLVTWLNDPQRAIHPSEITPLAERAAIGASGGQTRTLFPILAISVAIPLFIEFWHLLSSQAMVTLSSLAYLVIAILSVIYAVLALLAELGRASNDVIISHAVVELRRQRELVQMIADLSDVRDVQRMIDRLKQD